MRLAALAAAVSIGAAGCGGDGPGGLEITRADGSRVDIRDGVRAWCGATRGEATEELTGPLGLYVLGGEQPGADDEAASSFWIFVQPTAALETSTRTSLPNEGEAAAVFFVLDDREGNELSSAQEEASGTIELEEWGCDRGDTVRLSVEATLGSEFSDGPTARVEGTVETEIGVPPPQD